MSKRIVVSSLLGAALMLSPFAAPASHAGQLPDNCTKLQGTITCTTTLGPGKNQGGVGTTLTTTSQGNTTNKALTLSTCSPPQSSGVCG